MEESNPDNKGFPTQPLQEQSTPRTEGPWSKEEPPCIPTKRRLVQRPIYFICTVLWDAWERYPKMQKVLFGVLIASRKLHHYFEVHHITMVTSYPLEHVLLNRSAMGRIVEWSKELSGFDLHFTNTTTIKSKALDDFVTEWTPTPIDGEAPL
jgi:hypothetical protein